MTDQETRKKALMKRLSELDVRLHGIEAALDEPQSKDWEDNAVGEKLVEMVGRALFVIEQLSAK